MRHRNKNIILGREKKQRTALFRSLAENLILHGKITTTEAKAKALRSVVEPLISKARKGDLASLRSVGEFLYTEKALKKLVKDVAPKYKSRQGGYTRVIKLAPRRMDAAKMARIELV
jgi:large subunit ribosomal protein L17